MPPSFEPPKPWTDNYTPGLPRALQPGEVFCHRCRTFYPMADNTKHDKECKQLRRKGEAQ